MNDIIWLLGANIVFWLGLGGYALFLGIRQGRVERGLRQLEIMGKDYSNE